MRPRAVAGRYPRPCENTMIYLFFFHTRFGPGPQPGPPDPRGASSTLWLWEPVGDKSRSPAPPQGPSPPCMAPSVPTSTAPGPPPWRGDAGGLLGASGSGVWRLPPGGTGKCGSWCRGSRSWVFAPKLEAERWLGAGFFANRRVSALPLRAV